ncbi:MAG: phospholipase D family protein [Deltaproteobacteria bacterium]|nr:phospholipase D family protein [Deltaproteobacteria bacterium]
MLDPDDRRHLLESLRPPLGYELDRAIGTTFSLDLLALLIAPLAFTLFDWEDDNGNLNSDPLAMLETLRRFAGRVSIFCQAGQISVPKGSHQLYGYLEKSIFGVMPPHEQGVFHPKVWVLRFTAPYAQTRYRLLCLSRNLTFDSSWDTALVLDGTLVDRQNAFSTNHPLGDFIAALPEMVAPPRQLPDHVQSTVDLIQHELRRVSFELPEGFDEISFWPLGFKGARRWPFETRIDRMLIVSPFVSDGFLSRLTKAGQGHILVSRTEELDTLDQGTLKCFERVYLLSPAADPEEDGGADPEKGTGESLSGLHAKLFIADAGWNTNVWTGSANATDVAFKSNVEFLVQLTGKKSRWGLNTLIPQTGERSGFMKLLQEYFPDLDVTATDLQMKALEDTATEVRRRLAVMRLTAHVTGLEQQDLFQLQISHHELTGIHLPVGVSVRCWPITLSEGMCVGIGKEPGIFAEFSQVSFEALTSFFAFEITASNNEKKFNCRFVLNLTLEGAPEDRAERIMKSLLKTRDQVLRFILMLLAEGGGDVYQAIFTGRSLFSGGASNGSAGAGIPLFETLVRTLERNPAKLDQIAHLVDDLRKTEDGTQLLPEGFDAIWKPIWATRERIR